jgi:DNA polymerase IV
MTRQILHLDMNAYFASVEQQNDPALRGQPVGVIGSSGRTVVTTCSYEARRRGVKTGMNVWQAKSCCPELILVVGDNRRYTDTSKRIVAIMRDYTPLVEVFSIDEAFLDVTGSLALFGTPERIAYLLKARIRQQFGLTCSIGIAPNKLLAKLASDMHKPDGLTLIPPERVTSLLESLPVEELCGIGPRLTRQLNRLGIHSCGQLGRYPLSYLQKRYGIVGARLQQMARGIDSSPVIPVEEDAPVKSVGHSMTLREDISHPADIERFLLQLAEMVGRRARRYGVSGRTVHLQLRLADFDTNLGCQKTLPNHINQSDAIYRAAREILATLRVDQPIRLLGISLSNLRHQGEQLPLFCNERRKQRMTTAMDMVNQRFGDSTLNFASLLDNRENGSHVISPAWRPEGVRCIDVR